MAIVLPGQQERKRKPIIANPKARKGAIPQQGDEAQTITKESMETKVRKALRSGAEDQTHQCQTQTSCLKILNKTA